MGGAGSAYNIPFVAYLQENIPAEAQGRAFSLLGSLMSLAMPVGLLISSPVAQIFGLICGFWYRESVFWLWWLYAGFQEMIRGRLIFVRKKPASRPL